MTAPGEIMIEVDLEAAARKILRDPKGLVGVGAIELVALAEYALLPAPAPSMPASIAVAIAKLLATHQALDLARIVASNSPAREQAGHELADAVDAFNASLRTLQTAFEKEFPDGEN